MYLPLSIYVILSYHICIYASQNPRVEESEGFHLSGGHMYTHTHTSLSLSLYFSISLYGIYAHVNDVLARDEPVVIRVHHLQDLLPAARGVLQSVLNNREQIESNREQSQKVVQNGLLTFSVYVGKGQQVFSQTPVWQS